MDLAQLRQGELLAQEVQGDVRVLDLGAQPPQRVLHDLVVVEGEARAVVGGGPADVLALDRGRGLVVPDQGGVDDGDDALTGERSGCPNV